MLEEYCKMLTAIYHYSVKEGKGAGISTFSKELMFDERILSTYQEVDREKVRACSIG